MTDSEAILVRRAVRQYAMDSLPQRSLAQIGAQVAQLRTLSKESRVFFEILTGEQFSESYRCSVNAPYYVMIFAESTQDGRMNAGYMGEQLVLALTGMGLGTCWLGSVRSKEKTPKELPLQIVISFGTPQEAGLLGSAYTHKRKTLSALLLRGDAPARTLREALEGARLAPSAINMQPCRYLVCGNAAAVLCRKSVVPMLDRMRDIDSGIALAHIDAAAREHGMSMAETDLRAAAALPGYRYRYGFVLHEGHGA